MKTLKKLLKYIVIGPQKKEVKTISYGIKHKLSGHSNIITSLDISENEKYLASGSSDHSVRIWNLKLGNIKRTLEGHQNIVSALSFAPDGQTIATASFDKTIIIWSVVTGKIKFVLNGHTDKVWNISYSQDGKKLASSSADGTVRVWNTKTGSFIKTLPVQISKEKTKVISKNKTYKAVVSNHNTITVYEKSFV